MSEDPHEVIHARANEKSARLTAERLERELAIATREWERAKRVRQRAELWARADTLRKELARVEAEAAAIRL